MTDPPQKRRWPTSIDPGWATVVAAVLAIVGTVLTLTFQRGTDVTSARLGLGGGSVDTSTTSGRSSTSSTSSTTTGSSTAPVVSVVARLPEAQKAALQTASQGMLQAAASLPLIVKDDFQNNDYGWPVAHTIYAGGITCTTAVRDSAYSITVHAVNGAAYCMGGLGKVAKDFLVTSDEKLLNHRNADVFLYYRASEDLRNYYYAVYSPQTQLFSVGAVQDGRPTILLPSTFLGEITKNGANRLSVMALGSSHAFYLNDQLVVLISGEDRILSGGKAVFSLQLNEGNQDEVLVVDRYELRGS